MALSVEVLGPKIDPATTIMAPQFALIYEGARGVRPITVHKGLETDQRAELHTGIAYNLNFLYFARI